MQKSSELNILPNDGMKTTSDPAIKMNNTTSPFFNNRSIVLFIYTARYGHAGNLSHQVHFAVSVVEEPVGVVVLRFVSLQAIAV